MAEPKFASQIDLRDLRIKFLDRRTTYALSYAYELDCTDTLVCNVQPGTPGPEPSSVRLRLVARTGGEVFHVLGADRVVGLDGSGYDVPRDFRVFDLTESVALRVAVKPDGSINTSAALIEGRMIFEAQPKKGPKKERETTDGVAVCISVTYDGTLQFAQPLLVKDLDHAKSSLRATAFVVPLFETTHPKYHWLTENACIAFGTWEMEKGIVKASFDVYNAE